MWTHTIRLWPIHLPAHVPSLGGSSTPPGPWHGPYTIVDEATRLCWANSSHMASLSARTRKIQVTAQISHQSTRWGQGRGCASRHLGGLAVMAPAKACGRGDDLAGCLQLGAPSLDVDQHSSECRVCTLCSRGPTILPGRHGECGRRGEKQRSSWALSLSQPCKEEPDACGHLGGSTSLPFSHWSELRAHPDVLWQDPVSSSYWKHLGAMGACTPSLGKSTFALAPQESHGAALMAPPPCVQGVEIQWHHCHSKTTVMSLLGLTQPQLLVLPVRDQQSEALQGDGDFPGLSRFGQDALVPPCSASRCDQGLSGRLPGLARATWQADFHGELVTALEVPQFPLWLLYIRDLTTNLSSALESETSKTQTEFVLENS